MTQHALNRKQGCTLHTSLFLWGNTENALVTVLERISTDSTAVLHITLKEVCIIRQLLSEEKGSFSNLRVWTNQTLVSSLLWYLCQAKILLNLNEKTLDFLENHSKLASCQNIATLTTKRYNVSYTCFLQNY